MWNSPASGSAEIVGFGPVPDPSTNKRPFTNVLKTSIKELTVLPLICLTPLFWQMAEFCSLVMGFLFPLFIFDCFQSSLHPLVLLKSTVPVSGSPVLLGFSVVLTYEASAVQ